MNIVKASVLLRDQLIEFDAPTMVLPITSGGLAEAAARALLPHLEKMIEDKPLRVVTDDSSVAVYAMRVGDAIVTNGTLGGILRGWRNLS